MFTSNYDVRLSVFSLSFIGQINFLYTILWYIFSSSNVHSTFRVDAMFIFCYFYNGFLTSQLNNKYIFYTWHYQCNGLSIRNNWCLICLSLVIIFHGFKMQPQNTYQRQKSTNISLNKNTFNFSPYD